MILLLFDKMTSKMLILGSYFRSDLTYLTNASFCALMCCVGFDPSLVTSYEDLLKYVVRTEAGYTCPCGRLSPNSSSTNVQYHLESVHFRGHFLWNCNICGKEVENKRALLWHKKKVPRRINLI